MHALEDVDSPRSLHGMPGLHRLGGSLAGFWAMKVSKNWRIWFREREAMEESQRELADTADGLARRNEDLQQRRAGLEEEARRLRSDLQAARDGEARARIATEAQGGVADELRAQLAAALERVGTGLAERVEALERDRTTASTASRE